MTQLNIAFENMERDEDVVSFATGCTARLRGTTDLAPEGQVSVKVERQPRGARVQVLYDGVVLAQASDLDAVVATRAAFARLFQTQVDRVSTPPPSLDWIGRTSSSEAG